MKSSFHFGSTVAKYEVDSQILDQLNNICDQILDSKNAQKKLGVSHQLASAVNQEFAIPGEIIPFFRDHVAQIADEYHRNFSSQSELPLKPFDLHFWMVSQRESEWNHIHYHDAELTGFLYLKVPSNPSLGLPAHDKRGRLPGNLFLTEGNPGPYKKGLFHIAPIPGDLYIFPGNVNHGTYPFFGAEERRTLAFNLIIRSR